MQQVKTLGIGEIKTHFSEILGQVKRGQRIIISFGKKKEKVAMIVPYEECQPEERRQLGPLKGKAEFEIHDDFRITDEELLEF